MTKVPCCCDHDGEQLSLIHVPVAAKPTRKPIAGVRYAKVRPKTHQVCADCIAEIHRLGVVRAPYPRPVRWRRSETSGATLLCEAHKDARQEAETAAEQGQK